MRTFQARMDRNPSARTLRNTRFARHVQSQQNQLNTSDPAGCCSDKRWSLRRLASGALSEVAAESERDAASTGGCDSLSLPLLARLRLRVLLARACANSDRAPSPEWSFALLKSVANCCCCCFWCCGSCCLAATLCTNGMSASLLSDEESESEASSCFAAALPVSRDLLATEGERERDRERFEAAEEKDDAEGAAAASSISGSSSSSFPFALAKPRRTRLGLTSSAFADDDEEEAEDEGRSPSSSLAVDVAVRAADETGADCCLRSLRALVSLLRRCLSHIL